MMQNEIIENEKILKTMEIESKLYKNRLQSDEETTTTLDTTNLQWALLMLRQRTSTLSMFCLDVQCLIERRFDVTKLLNKVRDCQKLIKGFFLINLLSFLYQVPFFSIYDYMTNSIIHY